MLKSSISKDQAEGEDISSFANGFLLATAGHIAS
jgi:hypothetical protein